MTRRIPLTVIGGFLGAGKTTLLNRLLADAQGRRYAVLVNDFGAVNVDAALVAAASGDTIALTNGCVCCSIGDDLSAALVRVLDAHPPFDAIVVEASGVSDPWRIAQLALADAMLELGGVLVLADASALREQARDALLADTLERQLQAADLIVLNKTDLASPDELQALRGWLDALLPGTPRFETQHAELPRELLHGPRLGTGPHTHDPIAHHGRDHGRDHEHEHDHSHGHEHDHGHEHGRMFESWTARPAATLSAPVLRAALRAMPRGVLRLKGFVRTDELGWSEWQFAGRHGSLRRALAAPPDGAVLVAIALRGSLPAAELDALIANASRAV